jgi:hypothetical protein
VVARGVAEVALGGGAASVPSALDLAVRCAEVAKLLGDKQPEVFPGCDEACAKKLCLGALDTMWSRASRDDELKGSASMLTFAASGQGALDDAALLTGFTGSWVGAMTDPSAGKAAEVPCKGLASGGPPSE